VAGKTHTTKVHYATDVCVSAVSYEVQQGRVQTYRNCCCCCCCCCCCWGAVQAGFISFGLKSHSPTLPFRQGSLCLVCITVFCVGCVPFMPPVMSSTLHGIKSQAVQPRRPESQLFKPHSGTHPATQARAWGDLGGINTPNSTRGAWSDARNRTNYFNQAAAPPNKLTNNYVVADATQHHRNKEYKILGAY
jgi:hypothetical protein